MGGVAHERNPPDPPLGRQFPLVDPVLENAVGVSALEDLDHLRGELGEDAQKPGREKQLSDLLNTIAAGVEPATF